MRFRVLDQVNILWKLGKKGGVQNELNFADVLYGRPYLHHSVTFKSAIYFNIKCSKSGQNVNESTSKLMIKLTASRMFLHPALKRLDKYKQGNISSTPVSLFRGLGLDILFKQTSVIVQ